MIVSRRLVDGVFGTHNGIKPNAARRDVEALLDGHSHKA
jgi:hypothetical protein